MNILGWLTNNTTSAPPSAAAVEELRALVEEIRYLNPSNQNFYQRFTYLKDTLPELCRQVGDTKAYVGLSQVEIFTRLSCQLFYAVLARGGTQKEWGVAQQWAAHFGLPTEAMQQVINIAQQAHQSSRVIDLIPSPSPTPVPVPTPAPAPTPTTPPPVATAPIPVQSPTPTAAAPTAMPTSEPAIVPTSSTSSPVPTWDESIGIGQKTFERGHKILEAFDPSLGIQFLPEESSDAGLRHDRLRFVKPVSISFGEITKRRDEALSNAGVNPEIPTLFRKLKDNRFEFHIQRPEEEWRTAHFEDFLRAGYEGEEVHGRFRPWLEHRFRLPAHIEPSIPIGVDLDADEVRLNLGTGALIIGKPKGGKSNALKVLLAGIELTYHPDLAWFTGADFKDEGITLPKFDSSAWCWHPFATDPEGAEELFEKLLQERKRRAALIKGAGCEKIEDYNFQHPHSPIPWGFVIVDEVAIWKMQAKAKVDEILFPITNFWRSSGIVLICTTQYPNADLALGPAIRNSFGSKLAFNCQPEAAELLFGRNSPYKEHVHALLGKGDFIYLSETGFSRGQAFLLERESEAALFSRLNDPFLNYIQVRQQQWQQQQQRPHPQQPPLQEADPQPVQVQADSPVSSPPTTYPAEDDPWVDEEAALVRFSDYMRLVQEHRQTKGKPPTQRHILTMVIGDFYYPKDDRRYKQYQGYIESLDSLLDTDHRLKADRGDNLKTSKVLLDRLIQKFQAFQNVA